MKRSAIDHPKMLMLANELERIKAQQPTLGNHMDGLSGRLLAIGIMESLWNWCAKYAIQGDIGKWSNEAICRGIGYNWDADQLIDALVRCRWLDKHRKCRLVVHDIQDHADNHWKQTLQRMHMAWYDAKPARSGSSGRPLSRHKPPPKSPQCGDTDKDKSAPPVPVPVPEPEPVLEEDSSATQKRVAEPSAAPADLSPVILTYPTRGKLATWDLHQSLVDTWIKLYPGLDVLMVCRKALAWCMASPTRRKTARGMERCLVNVWLNREADGASHGRTTNQPARGSGYIAAPGSDPRGYRKGLSVQ